MIDEAKALAERLREKIVDTLLAGLPYNRDGDEAADLIETQAREIERLRGALGLIIENESTDTGYGNSSAKIARAALGDWKPEAGDLGGDHVR